MDPLDFLKVADNLKNSPDEAERRTAVSRAYYSVFNCIKSYLVQLSRMIDDLRTDRTEEVFWKRARKSIFRFPILWVKACHDNLR
jgi:hypothetical protein